MSPTPWSVRAEEILADGEWHTARELRETLKLIPPGVAVRSTERRRRTAQLRRKDEPGERVVERNLDTLIDVGKAALFQTMVHSRVRDQSWEVAPWPVPEMGWSGGKFKVRSLKARRCSVTAAAERLGTTKRVLNRFVEAGLLDHVQVGRVTYLLDLDATAKVLDEFRAGASTRRSQISRRSGEARRERLAAESTSKLTLTVLARRSLMAPRTAAMLADQATHLPWERFGRRVRYLPIEAIPEWNEAVEAWRSQESARRSTASKASRAAQRERGAR